MKTLLFDVLAVALFAFLARLAHGGLDPLAILNTFWPFALGTLLAWLLFRPDSSIAKGVPVWLCTVVVGLSIWSIRHHAAPHISFLIVASVMSGLLILGWRFLRKSTKSST